MRIKVETHARWVKSEAESLIEAAKQKDWDECDNLIDSIGDVMGQLEREILKIQQDERSAAKPKGAAHG